METGTLSELGTALMSLLELALQATLEYRFQFIMLKSSLCANKRGKCNFN